MIPGNDGARNDDLRECWFQGMMVPGNAGSMAQWFQRMVVPGNDGILAVKNGFFYAGIKPLPAHPVPTAPCPLCGKENPPSSLYPSLKDWKTPERFQTSNQSRGNYPKTSETLPGLGHCSPLGLFQSWIILVEK